MAKTLPYKKRKEDLRSTISQKKNRRGLSTIVTTVILVAISLAAVALVWVFVQNMVKHQISSSESCFGNYEKVQINKQYTCYERINSDNYSLRFSLSIEDILVDKVIVSVSSASAVKSYQITNTPTLISGLRMYPSNLTSVNLSNQNAGLSYKAVEFKGPIDSIKIAPVIGGNLCEVSDSFSEIEDCVLST